MCRMYETILHYCEYSSWRRDNFIVLFVFDIT